IAASACGNGPSGPSFDASLTTRSRPSSRWTSSTGFPGSYGIRPASAGRTKPAGTPPTLRAATGRGFGFLAPEKEGGDDRGADCRDGALVQARVVARAGDGLPGLLLTECLRDVPDGPPKDRVAPVDDPPHVLSFPPRE